VNATGIAKKMKKSKKARLRSYANILHNYPASFLLYCFSPYHFCMGFFISEAIGAVNNATASNTKQFFSSGRPG
jgi:hypothetical protein